MRKKIFYNFLLLFLSFTVHAGIIREISLEEVLRTAEENSPHLTVAKLMEIAAAKNADIIASKYFPEIKLDSIYSLGFPASSGITEVGGIMSSPYRSGLSFGIVAKQSVFDFGRTNHAIKAAKHEVELSEQNTRVKVVEIKSLALQKYYECSSFRTQQDLWRYFANESKFLTKEIEHFVDTGQRSVVDKYLSESQTEEAISLEAYFAERMKQTLRELKVIMGTPREHFNCALITEPQADTPTLKYSIDSTPLIARAIIEAKVAEEKLKEAKANLYPEIIATTSYGYMDKARLVPKKNYAVGVGISIPVFDLPSKSRVNKAAILAHAKKIAIASEKQFIEEILGSYEETIKSSEVFLKHLAKEAGIASEAFNVAKNRYISLEGTLIDVRESFRNLIRVRTELLNTQTKLLQTRGAKILLMDN